MHLHMFSKQYFDNYFSKNIFEVHEVSVEKIGSCDHYVGLFTVK